MAATVSRVRFVQGRGDHVVCKGWRCNGWRCDAITGAKISAAGPLANRKGLCLGSRRPLAILPRRARWREATGGGVKGTRVTFTALAVGLEPAACPLPGRIDRHESLTALAFDQKV